MSSPRMIICLSVVDGGQVKTELSEISDKGDRSLKKREGAPGVAAPLNPPPSDRDDASRASNDAKFQLEAADRTAGSLQVSAYDANSALACATALRQARTSSGVL